LVQKSYSGMDGVIGAWMHGCMRIWLIE